VSADVAKYQSRRGRGPKDAALADAPAGGTFGKESGLKEGVLAFRNNSVASCRIAVKNSGKRSARGIGGAWGSGGP
jgi:hypothetical protein